MLHNTFYGGFLVSGILITDHITFESKEDLHKRKYKLSHYIFSQGHKACHLSKHYILLL